MKKGQFKLGKVDLSKVTNPVLKRCLAVIQKNMRFNDHNDHTDRVSRHTEYYNGGPEHMESWTSHKVHTDQSCRRRHTDEWD